MTDHNDQRNGDAPPTQTEDLADANPRLLEAVREYQAAIDAGRKPNRRDFLARYADVAGELADCLDGLDFVHSAASHLTGSDVPKSSRPASELLNPEQPLGDFRLVREIGRGGMGIVYEAVQLSLGRRVALKVLPFAATLDPRQLQRFKTEAQAAAQLHHGHIVPVFFVGSERNVHFYAMQYIEGQTLAALIADLHHQSPKFMGPMGRMRPISPIEVSDFSKESMGPGAATIASQHSTDSRAFFRTVAQLGVQAAEALEHAHQMGIIHRDVKPANLLLDQRGCLWITDFGLARVQTDAGATITGDIVGTVRYMSPEQALGKPLIDQRTDVYSLGATLYELLTLTPVFDGRNRQDFLRQIVECEPPSPRSYNPAIVADLETIVLKALAKAPEERYATAQELADDLRRFLEDKPIQARRPSLMEKASKWSRRHRALVGAAVVLLAVAVVGLSVSTIVIAREQTKTQLALSNLELEQKRREQAFDALAIEQERTKKERDRAAKNLQNARRVLAYFTQVTEEDLKGKPGVAAIRLKLLEQVIAFYKAFIDDYRDDPDTSAELAEICESLAPLLNDLGAKADAVAMLELSRRLQDMRPPPFGGPGGGPGGGGRGGPEGPRGGGPGLFSAFLQSGGGFSATMLLGQEAIQKDLKVSVDQKAEIKAVLEKHKPPRGDGRPPSEAEREKRQAEVAKIEKKLTDLLSEAQRSRLQQLIWQQRGTFALGDKEVADALLLNDDQRERIHTLQDKAQRNMWSPNGGGRRGPDGPRPDEFWKDVSEKTLLVLTAEQRSRWKAMLGEPFHGEVRFGGPPMR